MAKPQMKRGPKGKGKDAGRKFKKKVSILNSENVEYVDWKDVNLLRRFVSDRAKVRARRVTGNDVQQQREIARAIKNAREMALIPYANRVTTQRGGRGGRGDRPVCPPRAPGSQHDRLGAGRARRRLHRRHLGHGGDGLGDGELASRRRRRAVRRLGLDDRLEPVRPPLCVVVGGNHGDVPPGASRPRALASALIIRIF